MSKVVIAFLVVLISALIPATALAQPDVCGFYGKAAIKGQDVSNGTVIKAWIGGKKVDETTTNTVTADGITTNYQITIENGQNNYDGKTITFTIGPDDLMAGTAIWKAGARDRLDLNGTEEMPSPNSPLPDPSITLIPTEGIATRISGEGFTRGSTIAIMVGNKSAGSAIVNNDDDGTFSIVIAAPDQNPGTYTVKVTDTANRADQATLLVPDLQGEPGIEGDQGPVGPPGPEGESGGGTLALVAIILAGIAVVLAILLAIRVSSFLQKR